MDNALHGVNDEVCDASVLLLFFLYKKTKIKTVGMAAVLLSVTMSPPDKIKEFLYFRVV